MKQEIIDILKDIYILVDSLIYVPTTQENQDNQLKSLINLLEELRLWNED